MNGYNMRQSARKCTASEMIHCHLKNRNSNQRMEIIAIKNWKSRALRDDETKPIVTLVGISASFKEAVGAKSSRKSTQQ